MRLNFRSGKAKRPRNKRLAFLLLHLAGGALLYASNVHGAGSFDVCAEPLHDSSLRAAYDIFDSSEFADGTLDRNNWAVDLAVAAGEGWLVGGAYRGTLIDESGVGFQTNGYLHSFYGVLHRMRADGRPVRWAVAPALSGSSNVTKDPDQYDGDAWQLLLAAVWEQPVTHTLAWRAGLCADHRFGRYRTYPVAALAWQPNADWLVEAGFPDTRIRFRPTGSLTAAFAVYPNGNEWYVKDKSLERASMFEYRAWAAELSLTWLAAKSLSLTATGGADVDAEYRADLMDGSRPTLDAGTVGRIGLEVAWTF